MNITKSSNEQCCMTLEIDCIFNCNSLSPMKMVTFDWLILMKLIFMCHGNHGDMYTYSNHACMAEQNPFTTKIAP